MQHLWAAMSEKVADRYGHEIKYGAGREDWGISLLELSNQVHEIELMQDDSEHMAGQVRAIGERELIEKHDAFAKGLDELRGKLRDDLERLATNPNNLAGET